VTYSFRPYHGTGVDTTPNENEYQDYLLGVKTTGAWGWQPHDLHVPNDTEIWKTKSPGTLWVTPGLLRLLGLLPCSSDFIGVLTYGQDDEILHFRLWRSHGFTIETAAPVC